METTNNGMSHRQWIACQDIERGIAPFLQLKESIMWGLVRKKGPPMKQQYQNTSMIAKIKCGDNARNTG